MTYQVSGGFTNIPAGSSQRFLDTDSAHLVLLRVGDNGLLATRSESWQGMGQTKSTVIAEKWNKVADGIGVRETSLQPGKYAYVGLTTANMGLGPTRLSDPVFPFEVQ